MFDDGAKGEGGEELQARDDKDDADQQTENRPLSVGKVPAEGWPFFLAAIAPAMAMTGTT